jgi:hypothetical protein
MRGSLPAAIAVLLVAQDGFADSPVTVAFGGSPAEAKRLGAALARTRVTRALVLARRDYAESAFERCERRLLDVECGLRIRGTGDDAELLKRLEQWLGLCQAAYGAEDAAALSFRRSAKLPGPPPDPAIFPPPIMELHQRAIAGDQPGDRTCEDASPIALTAEEAGDGAFLAEVGRNAGVEQLVMVSVAGDRSTLRTFDAQRGDYATEVAGAEPRNEDAWYESWWVWGLIGAAAATAVFVPILLSESNDPASRYTIGF